MLTFNKTVSSKGSTIKGWALQLKKTVNLIGTEAAITRQKSSTNFFVGTNESYGVIVGTVGPWGIFISFIAIELLSCIKAGYLICTKFKDIFQRYRFNCIQSFIKMKNIYLQKDPQNVDVIYIYRWKKMGLNWFLYVVVNNEINPTVWNKLKKG